MLWFSVACFGVKVLMPIILRYVHIILSCVATFWERADHPFDLTFAL